MKKLSIVMIFMLLVSLFAVGFTTQAESELVLEQQTLLDMSEVTDFAAILHTGADVANEGTIDGEKGLLTGTTNTRFKWDPTINLTDWQYVGFRVNVIGTGKMLAEVIGDTTGQGGSILNNDFLLVNLDGSIEDELVGSYEPEIADFDGWVYVSTLSGVWQGGTPFERALGEVVNQVNPTPGWERIAVNTDANPWSGLYFSGDFTVTFGDIVVANDATPPDPNTPKIYAGTPVMDGKLDEMYKYSARVGLGSAFYNMGECVQADSAIDGATYLLHDDANIYLCTEITGDSYVGMMEGEVTWVNDAVEHSLRVAGKGLNISAALDGTVFKNAAGVEGVEVKTSQTENSWIVEIKVPCTIVYDKLVEYGLQVNNLLSAEGALVAHGVQAVNREFLFSDYAAAPAIKKATVTVDGVLDDLYKESLCVEVGPTFYQHNGATPEDSTITGKTYFLHDDAKLYICTVVENDTFVGTHEHEDLASNWMSDAAEHYLNIGKTNASVSVTADNLLFKNPGNATVASATTKTENGWVVEIAIDYADAEYIQYGSQINDMVIDATSDKIVAYGIQKAALKYALSDEAAIIPTVPPTEAPTDAPTQAPTDAPTEVPTDAPTAAPTDAPAAKGGFPVWIIIVAAVVVVAVVVVVILLGKKKK